MAGRKTLLEAFGVSTTTPVFCPNHDSPVRMILVKELDNQLLATDAYDPPVAHHGYCQILYCPECKAARANFAQDPTCHGHQLGQ